MSSIPACSTDFLDGLPYPGKKLWEPGLWVWQFQAWSVGLATHMGTPLHGEMYQEDKIRCGMSAEGAKSAQSWLAANKKASQYEVRCNP